MGDTSDYSSYHPYPSYMPYPPYYPPYPPYPMFSPPPHYQNPANPNAGSAAPPFPPPAEPIIHEIRPPKPNPSVGSKVKMTNYLKLDVPKYKEGDEPFEYIKAMKMIADELRPGDSGAMQMAGFTMKCKKTKEWFKNYVESKLDGLS
ncbi:extensin-like [Manihot esculenta]|uniref:extensin-like n=1 Tax=Manihot esculenta TaxID=3983 RepID=UPI000B5D8E3F|nr:extensin-like [Manihot esculenta]